MLTTSNFPDIMLPAYQQSRLNCVFFIVFLLISLFFMQSIILAVVFEYYKKNLKNKMEAQLNDRTKQIELAFDEYDDGNKGYLTIDETKRFFHKVLDLNFDCP